jgi:hypothetical protein
MLGFLLNAEAVSLVAASEGRRWSRLRRVDPPDAAALLLLELSRDRQFVLVKR